MTAPSRRKLRSTPERPSWPEPVYCTLGDTLCRVHIWTDEEWQQLDPDERPAEAVHYPDIGWVAPVLVGKLS
jgi:hypothetical protein